MFSCWLSSNFCNIASLDLHHILEWSTNIVFNYLGTVDISPVTYYVQVFKQINDWNGSYVTPIFREI